MSSAKESNDVSTQKGTPTDVETDSQASQGQGKRGWFSARNLIILGVAAITSLLLIGGILFFALPSSTSSESGSPRAEALIGVSTTTMKSVDSTKLAPKFTPSGSKVTPSGFITTSEDELPTSSEKPTATSEEPVDVEKSTEDASTAPKLIFAQALFRHGARSPTKYLTSEERKKYFPRGWGELTDRGFNHSYLMGLFLKKRYVDSGFLSSDMVPAEMHWYSRSKTRLLSTASTVGAAMFRNSIQKYTSVPIQTQTNDYLLNFGRKNCDVMKSYWEERCPGMLNFTDELDEYPTILKCIFDEVPPVFKLFDVNHSDKLINMVRNEIPVPQNVTDNYRAISEEYMKVRNFKNGIGMPSVIQVRFGILVDTILKDIRKAWKEHEANNQTLKFKVYSTQDWVMSGVLDAFGLHHHILSVGPQEEPNYNVMILIELWKNSDGEAYVKFLYKPEEVTEEDHVMMDLTEFVPGCEGKKECPRKMFDNCCNSTRTTRKEQEELCYPDYDDHDDDDEDDVDDENEV